MRSALRGRSRAANGRGSHRARPRAAAGDGKAPPIRPALARRRRVKERRVKAGGDCDSTTSAGGADEPARCGQTVQLAEKLPTSEEDLVIRVLDLEPLETGESGFHSHIPSTVLPDHHP